MKVLVVHNFYRSTAPSGEDAVVRDEIAMLRRHGVDVVTFERHNDTIRDTPVDLLRTAVETVWSRTARRELTALIARERPDVAHFHNLWYRISPSVYEACRDAGVPIVQTVHNFRMFCANGLLLKDGRACDDCVGRLPWRGLVRGCYRSRAHSAPVIASEAFHRLRDTWSRRVDAFIALSDHAKEKLITCGLPGARIVVKPNSFAGEVPAVAADGGYAVFIGRLSREKGVEPLLQAAALARVPLKIVGDGPLRGALESDARAKGLGEVEFLGQLEHSDALRVLASASVLVAPSLCYENSPRAIVEAFALSKPVIASRLGGQAEIVEHGQSGLLGRAGDASDLASMLKRILGSVELRRSLGENARAVFERSYSPTRNAATLVDVYRRLTSCDASPPGALESAGDPL